MLGDIVFVWTWMLRLIHRLELLELSVQNFFCHCFMWIARLNNQLKFWIWRGFWGEYRRTGMKPQILLQKASHHSSIFYATFCSSAPMNDALLQHNSISCPSHHYYYYCYIIYYNYYWSMLQLLTKVKIDCQYIIIKWCSVVYLKLDRNHPKQVN